MDKFGSVVDRMYMNSLRIKTQTMLQCVIVEDGATHS
jgi:hypothetical protein